MKKTLLLLLSAAALHSAEPPSDLQYSSPSDLVDLDSASDRPSPASSGQGEEEDRFYEVVASPNSLNLTGSSIQSAKPKDSISYVMVGAAAPFNENAINKVSPNLSYGMRHFGNIHAKDYCLTLRGNQEMQSLIGQYSFLFFPIVPQGFAKTHSALYLGVGLSGGLNFLSKALAEQGRQVAIHLLEEQRKTVSTPEEAELIDEAIKKIPTIRIVPFPDIPLTLGYQFANTNFVQVQLSTLFLAQKFYSGQPGNGIYATFNYGFGF